MGYPSDFVNLTFDPAWNWVFTGAQDPAESALRPFLWLSADAFCLPWKSLTNSGTYNAYFGTKLSSGSGDMGAPRGKYLWD